MVKVIYKFNEENNYKFIVSVDLELYDKPSMYVEFYILDKLILIDYTQIIINSYKYYDLIQNHERGINAFLSCYLSKFLPNIFKKQAINLIVKYINKFYKIKGWTIIKSLTKLLSLHKRAVVTANHPDRLKLSGVFQEL